MGVNNLVRAAVSPVVPRRTASAPDVVLLDSARADPQRLRAYAHTCGFEPNSSMPPTYPHVLAFNLAMRLMTRRDFPFAAPGLVHIRNTVTVHRPIDTTEALTLHVRAGGIVGHPKGRTVDVVTSASIDGSECWTERSTYLHREKAPRTQRAATPHTEAADQAGSLPTTATWELPGTLGRRYARVSGDWNPIHLHAWTSRFFGFGRPIAHGMWTMARALSEMDLPDGFTADVAFLAPIALPSQVAFATDGARIAVRPVDSPDARPHLVGNVADLSQR